MALAATTIWELRTGGSDTANGGGFDPGQTAGMLTDGAATSATGTAPVFTSASYNFVVGDVGAKIYIASGTNWIAGWYAIASVASNAATLNGTIGQAVLAAQAGLSTVTGCASTASPTSATWSIDYSQQAAAQFAYTDLASVGAGLAVSSVAFPFGKQQVGNAIIIASGTNFTAGVYVIASVAATVATVVGAANITTGAGVLGVGGQGGAFASPGKAGLVHVAGNKFWMQTGTFTVTSASNNVAGGCLSIIAQAASANAAKLIGYATYRGDRGSRPTIIASGISTFALVVVAAGNHIENIIFDGASLTGSRGLSNGNGTCYLIKAQNCTNSGINGGDALLCEVTSCSTVIALATASALFCYTHANTFTGYASSSSSAMSSFVISSGNTGGSSHGFDFQFGAGHVANCTFYGNGGSGIICQAAAGNAAGSIVNCICYGNTGYGINFSALYDHMYVFNCALGGNTAGTINNSPPAANLFNIKTLTGDPFTNAASGDFSLNNTSGAGTLCRAAGIIGAFQAGTTTTYIDLGATQHQDSGGSAAGGLQFIGA